MECIEYLLSDRSCQELKAHMIHGSVFASRKETNAVSFDYIEIYYNRVRRHSANDWSSPEASEQKYFKSLAEPTVYHTV